LSRLHEAGLLVSDAAGQGEELLQRHRTQRLRRWSLAWTQLTAIRFRGINPDAALTTVHWRCRWLFSRTAAVLAALVVLLAASIVVGHFDEVRARLPELSVFADWRNLFWLLATIGFVKVCHELGHALACKHFGGEVPEMGVLLLVFVPCLYCDVTDAWRFAGKWQRILVSAAGMLVELVTASMATIVWWYAQPGLVQLVALDVMIVSTVHTLAVNGNPLLRYDGYYILSDLVESPFGSVRATRYRACPATGCSASKPMKTRWFPPAIGCGSPLTPWHRRHTTRCCSPPSYGAWSAYSIRTISRIWPMPWA
jgi:putative peptide zinc metalloprotease protein